MSKLLDKVMSLMGLEEEEYDTEEEEILEQPEEPYLKRERDNLRNQNKIVNIHSAGHFKVVIIQPETFEQAREITEHLKGRKPVIANVEGLEKNQAQRIVDFLSGSVYALNGNIQRVSHGIFLIAPQNVDILGGMKRSHGEKGEFAWIK
jgi:cell division inhibitor SepF